MPAGGIHVIEQAGAPAIGDVRDAGDGDCIYIRRDATRRADWPRYWEAVGTAYARGALVSFIREGSI